MKAIFVAGIDTGVGKTVVTGLLAGYLARKGYSVVTQKWAGTGPSSDIDAHIRLSGAQASDFTGLRDAMSPYHFKFAASPHLAARLEARRVEPGRIRRDLRRLSGRFDIVIVEGVGGLLVPLSGGTLAIDMVKDLKLPVVLVAANRLGAINHALLSLEALRSRRIDVVGIVFNATGKENRRVMLNNPGTVKRFGRMNILGVLPHRPNLRLLDRHFEPIGERIERYCG